MRYVLTLILIAGLLVGCDDSTTTQALLPVASTTISAANPTSEPAPTPDSTPDPTATPTSDSTPTPTPAPTATPTTDPTSKPTLSPTATPTSEPTVTNAGTKIAFVRRPEIGVGGWGDIYIMDADGSNVRQLTDDPGSDSNPAWSRVP